MLSFLKSMWEQTHTNELDREVRTHQWWMIIATLIVGLILFLELLTHLGWVVAGFVGAAIWHHREGIVDAIVKTVNDKS